MSTTPPSPSLIAARRVAHHLQLSPPHHPPLRTSAPRPISFQQQPPQQSCKYNVVIVEVPTPSKLDTTIATAFWEKTILTYTIRAFGESPETITPESKREHFEHAIPGDALYLAVAVESAANEEDAEGANVGGEGTGRGEYSLLFEQLPHVVGHELVDFGNIPSFNEELTELGLQQQKRQERNETERRCLFCTGICTDPLVQGQGVASYIHHFVIGSAVDGVVLRTVNPAIVKMLRRTSPPGTFLFPNDCFEQQDDEKRSEKFWAVASKIANFVVPRWGHLNNEIEKFDAKSLCFRGAYAADRQKVFGQRADAADDVDEMSPRKARPGDAVLRIALFPF